MTHQLAPATVARTPAAGRHAAPRAKVFQQAPACVPATPRTGLALLGNDNNAAPVAKATSAAFVKPQPTAAAAQAEQAPELAPPPASAYEAPFEWEFLPDTDDWLRLLRRFGSGGVGCGGGGGGGGGGAYADYLNNKENVPPSPPSSPSPSASPPGCRHWEESPTRRPRHRRREGDDCVDICFDIDRIL